jgi:hypothetical protein
MLDLCMAFEGFWDKVSKGTTFARTCFKFHIKIIRKLQSPRRVMVGKSDSFTGVVACRIELCKVLHRNDITMTAYSIEKIEVNYE